MKKHIFGLLGMGLLSAHWFVHAADNLDVLKSQDIFSLEYASGLEVSNDGQKVLFVRNFMDIQSDRKLSNIWSVDTKTKTMRPITTGDHVDYSPLLSPDQNKVAFISTRTGSPQIYIRWLDTGQLAKISNLTSSPGNLSWSPDGEHIVFSMFVEKPQPSPVNLPGKPKGAKWSAPAKFIDDVYYRFDGGGYTTKGSPEIFIIPLLGGTPRQITNDEFDNSGPYSWSQDGTHIFYSANRDDNREFAPLNSEVYALSLDDLSIDKMTDRDGPDSRPIVSPNGKLIAFTGFNDKRLNYDNSQLFVMDIDGKNIRQITQNFDRNIDDIAWAASSKAVYIQYDDNGKSVLALQSLRKGKKPTVLADALGGQSYGRPYTGAEFAVSKSGKVAFTLSNPLRPADVAVLDRKKVTQLTALNEDFLAHKSLAQIEEIWFKSSADERDIQGWIAYPPGFDKTKKYPLLLEIHGGPVTAYGPHFSMEVQLYAAAGNVVLYTNPRGSSSYGKEFANTIDKNYPSQDYDDLMSGVDAVIEKGFIDEQKLYVTGGSGGGVLTAWTIGHTDRFSAAVVAKPVINWISFVLTADFYPYFYQYWFDKKPWDDISTYMKYSPISYVGNVKTPTMLLTGESDFRTPISETEQYYQALKIQGVPTAMVRIPNASHGIYRKPSNLMAKVEYILWWFEQHNTKSEVTKNHD